MPAPQADAAPVNVRMGYNKILSTAALVTLVLFLPLVLFVALLLLLLGLLVSLWATLLRRLRKPPITSGLQDYIHIIVTVWAALCAQVVCQRLYMANTGPQGAQRPASPVAARLDVLTYILQPGVPPTTLRPHSSHNVQSRGLQLRLFEVSVEL